MQEPVKDYPEWINVELLQNAVRSYKDDDSVEIEDFVIKSGFNEHIASVMFQCRIHFQISGLKCETLNVVVKARPVTDGLKAVACEGPLFENEIKMYTSTIPLFDQLFKRFGMKIDLAPEFIYATDHPFPIIILKDLTVNGYFAPRIPFDDLADTKQMIRRLAQFHAASFYLSEMNQVDLHNYNYNVYENESLIYGMYKGSVKVFQEVLEMWDGYQEYIPRLEVFMKQIGDIGRKSHTANKPNVGYNVLNHGDFHLRNILVKLNTEKKLQQFRFIDYQLSIYGSPAIDINYVYSLLKHDDNGNVPFEDVVVFYHEEFEKTLKLFGFSKYIPTLIDLNIELIRHGRTNVLMMIVYTPMAFMDWNTTKMEDFWITNESDEKAKSVKKSLYNHSICKSIMQRMLKSFAHKGWL